MLADVCTITMGQAPPGSSYNDRGQGMPLIAGAGDFNGNSIAPTKFTTSPGKVSKPGDIVLSIRASIGAKAWANGTYCLGRGVASLRPGPNLDDKYLWYWITRYEQDLAAKGRGATFLQVSKNDIGEMLIEIPPLAEQRRIAAILDRADTLRAKRRQTMSYLDTLIQATFREMFGDLYESRWEKLDLGELINKIDNGTSPNCENRPAGPDEWGVLKLGAVTYGNFRVNENKAYLGDIKSMIVNEVRSGDVLMTRKNTRELVGAVALVNEVRPRLLLPDLIFRLHLDAARLDRYYFQALMMSPQKRAVVRDLSSGSASSMPNISKSRLSKLRLELPPLPLQQEFARQVQSISRLRAFAESSACALDELFTSLQSRAFRGEL